MDIFENISVLHWVCAIKAYKKYQSNIGTPEPNQPLVTFHDVAGYTGRMFEEDLKTLLTGRVDIRLGPLTTHSCRAGIATMMAEAGCLNKEIKLAGTWSSDAFKFYIKTARPRRAIIAEEVWGRLSQCRAVTNRH